MSGFSVDVAGLAAMAKGLRDSSDRLRSVSGRLADASAEELGGRELDDACGKFTGDWKYGLGKLSDLAGDVADRVDEAVKVYQENDEEVAKAMAGSK